MSMPNPGGPVPVNPGRRASGRLDQKKLEEIKQKAEALLKAAQGEKEKERLAQPYTLNWEPRSSVNKESVCGGFTRERDWRVGGAKGIGGAIIQKVTRKFAEVKEYDRISGLWIDMSDSRIDTYVTHSSVNATLHEYWEAWVVDPSTGQVVNGDGDAFALPSIIPKEDTDPRRTTKGAFEIVGEANFFPGLTEAKVISFGFGVIAGHPANGLLAKNGAPAFDKKYDEYWSPIYSVKSTWDSDFSLVRSCFADVYPK